MRFDPHENGTSSAAFGFYRLKGRWADTTSGFADRHDGFHSVAPEGARSGHGGGGQIGIEMDHDDQQRAQAPPEFAAGLSVRGRRGCRANGWRRGAESLHTDIHESVVSRSRLSMVDSALMATLVPEAIARANVVSVRFRIFFRTWARPLLGRMP